MTTVDNLHGPSLPPVQEESTVKSTRSQSEQGHDRDVMCLMTVTSIL